MDNNLPHTNKGAQQWRCVDWSTEKANDRFIKGKSLLIKYLYNLKSFFTVNFYKTSIQINKLELLKQF